MADYFVYSALPKGCIRLLNITCSVGGELTFRLNPFSLSSLPEFYALSYTWGSIAATESIICDEKCMRIAANLNEAIHTLYNPPLKLDMPIWIDGVCINQQDDVEKADQVSRMGDIYGKARQVVVWLGPPSLDSDIAMEWIQPLATALPLISQPPLLQTLPKHNLPSEEHPLWAALGHLYRRKWFGRLWTFQEVVLATDVLMVCGQKTAEMAALATVARELNRLRLYPFCVGYQAIELHEDGFRAMESVTFARMVLADYGPLLTPTLLMIADTKLVTDARDRVYGILGLTSRSFRERIFVSYTSEASDGFLQTYIDCAKACIEEEMLLILQLVAGRPGVPGLPSWCPNLNYNQGTILPFGEYLQAGILDGSTPFSSAKTSLRSNILSITGFRVDIVSEVVKGTFHWPHVTNDKQPSRAQQFLDWEARCLLAAQRIYSPAPGVVPIGHIYTVTANTRARVSKEGDDNLRQAYLDILVNVRRNAQDGGNAHPPQERLALYNDSWQQIFRSCAGRGYFTTEGGRVGLGPPGMERGDIVCVFYGSPPVFVLRAVEGKEGTGWLLKGDAFLYDLMELKETLLTTKAVDEVFDIF